MAGQRVLVVFESKEGHTAEVAERIRASLEREGLEARALACRKARKGDLAAAEGVILGASVHMGKHARRAVRFARKHRELLSGRPAAFFSVSLTAASPKPDKRAELERYLAEFQAKSGWRPALIRTFAGAIPFSRYGWFKRKIMIAVGEQEKLQLDPGRDYVYTDWDRVEAFAAEFARLLS